MSEETEYEKSECEKILELTHKEILSLIEKERQFDFEREMELYDNSDRYPAFQGFTLGEEETVWLTELFREYIVSDKKGEIKCLVKAKRGTLLITVIEEDSK